MGQRHIFMSVRSSQAHLFPQGFEKKIKENKIVGRPEAGLAATMQDMSSRESNKWGKCCINADGRGMVLL